MCAAVLHECTDKSAGTGELFLAGFRVSVRVIDEHGNETEAEAEMFVLELPMLVEHRTAGVGANSVVARVDVDASFLHRGQFVIVHGFGQLLRRIVRAIEAERLVILCRKQTVTGQGSDIHPMSIRVREVFLRLDVMLKVFGHRGVEFALVRRPAFVHVALLGTSSEVTEAFVAFRHIELNAEAGQVVCVLPDGVVKVEDDAALGEEGVDHRHAEEGRIGVTAERKRCVDLDGLVGYFTERAGIALDMCAVKAEVVPDISYVTVIVGRSAPDGRSNRCCQHLSAVVHDGGNQSVLFADGVNRFVGTDGHVTVVFGCVNTCVGCDRIEEGSRFDQAFQSNLFKPDFVADLRPRLGFACAEGQVQIAFTGQCKSGEVDREDAHGLRLDGNGGELSFPEDLSVAFNRVIQIEVGHILKEPEAAEFQFPGCLIESVNAEGLDDLLVFKKSHVRTAIGIHQSVHAEVGAVRAVAEVSAVDVLGVPVNVVARCDRMITEFPDTAAEEFVMRVDVVPVFLETPGTVAHGVRVFAEEEWCAEVLSVLEINAVKIRGRRVHLARDIIVIQIELRRCILFLCVVVPGFSARRVLAVNEGMGIASVDVVRLRALIAADAVFVSERPEDHARVVLITLKHPGGTVHIGVMPRRIVRQLVPVGVDEAVCLKVGLVADVEAVFVAQFQKTRVVRVMAGTDHVDVVLFHDHKVADHVVHRRCVSEDRVAVVAVDALAFDLLAVDVQHIVSDGQLLEADLLADMLRAAGEKQGIQPWLLIVPENGRRHADTDFLAGSAFGDCCAFGREQTVRNFRVAVALRFNHKFTNGEILV